MRHAHPGATLHFGRVALHPDKGVAVEGRGEILPDAVGALLVRHGDAEALCFIFQLFLEDELFQDLLGVERFELLGDLAALFDLRELRADIGHRNGLAADLCHRVRGRFPRTRPLRHKVSEHGHTQHAHQDAKQNPNRCFSTIEDAGHPSCLQSAWTNK